MYMYMYNIKANAILSDFRHISEDLRVRIMRAYCSSYYGSQLWNLSNKCLERLYTSCRKSIRKAFNIPMRTHCAYNIPLLCKCMPLNVQLEQRFFMQGLHSNNSTFCLLTRQISTQSNVKRIMYKY